MVLTVSFALLGEPGFLAPLAGAIISRRLDTSVGVSGPHDFAVRSSAVRPREKLARRLASIAARLTSGDDWPKRPSCIEAGCRQHAYYSEKQKMNIFEPRTGQPNQP